MHVQELKLSKRLTEVLVEAGLDSVGKVVESGREGLLAIDGIGPASADDILAAAERISALPDKDVTSPQLQPSVVPLNPTERVSVRNASDVPVLVGGKYMFPGDVRVIRRYQMKAGLVEQGAGA